MDWSLSQLCIPQHVYLLIHSLMFIARRKTRSRCHPEHDQGRKNCRPCHPHWWPARYRKDSPSVSTSEAQYFGFIGLWAPYQESYWVHRFVLKCGTCELIEFFSSLEWVWQRAWEKRHPSPCWQVQKFSHLRCPKLKLWLKLSESQLVSIWSWKYDLGITNNSGKFLITKNSKFY